MLFILRISLASALAVIAPASDGQRFGFVEWALCLVTIFVLVFWKSIGIFIDGDAGRFAKTPDARTPKRITVPAERTLAAAE